MLGRAADSRNSRKHCYRYWGEQQTGGIVVNTVTDTGESSRPQG